jgi:hypothetical protein
VKNNAHTYTQPGLRIVSETDLRPNNSVVNNVPKICFKLVNPGSLRSRFQEMVRYTEV